MAKLNLTDSQFQSVLDRDTAMSKFFRKRKGEYDRKDRSQVPVNARNQFYHNPKRGD